MADSAAVSSDKAPVVLRVVPAEDEWGARNDKWRADAFELEQVLRRHLRDAVRQPTPVETHKGVDVVAVIIALGSAGAFTAAVEGFKAWLSRKPVRRRLVVDYEADGTAGSLTIDAENVDSGDLANIVDRAFKARDGG